MSDLAQHLYSSLNVNGPAPLARPGPGNGGTSSDATSILQSPEALSFIARILRAQDDLVKDKSYQLTPIGERVARFIRNKQWDNLTENTIISYEPTLAKLALYYGDRRLEELDRDDYRRFLQELWGDAAPATRAQRLSAVKSLLEWEVDEGYLAENVMAREKRPKQRDVERQAYEPDVIDQLRDAQKSLRDQIGCQLLGRLALRRNELRLVRISDFRLDRSTVRIHGKGGKIVDLPIGFRRLRQDIEVHIVGRGEEEYLIYPKKDPLRPMSSSGIHDWFKRCLKAAGLPSAVMMHEMRHSSADNLWRETGDLMLAKTLLRHASVGTTEKYLHPRMEDLGDALARLDDPVPVPARLKSADLQVQA